MSAQPPTELDDIAARLHDDTDYVTAVESRGYEYDDVDLGDFPVVNVYPRGCTSPVAPYAWVTYDVGDAQAYVCGFYAYGDSAGRRVTIELELDNWSTLLNVVRGVLDAANVRRVD